MLSIHWTDVTTPFRGDYFLPWRYRLWNCLVFFKKNPVVIASDIGKAKICPHSLSIKHAPKSGRKPSYLVGIEKHEQLTDYMLAKDRRCFVATYALGEDHPDTIKLRAWRDRVLMKSFAGRVFVRTYYAASPLAIDFLGASRLFKSASASFVSWLARWVGERG